MINRNEPTASKRRIPFYLVDSATGKVGQTGVSLTGSDLQLSKNGAAFTNFTGTISEVGNGLYYYECAPSEVDTLGFLAMKIVKTGCRTIMQVEVISGIGFYSTNFRLPLYLVDDSDGITPVTGLSFSGADIQLSEGAGWFDFSGDWAEVGSGLYYYAPLALEYASSGFLCVKVVKAGVRTYVLSQDLEEGTYADIDDPTLAILALPTEEEGYAQVQLYDDNGFNYIQITAQDRSDGPKMIAYETGHGFYHPFNGISTLTGSGTSADPYIFKIYRRGRWPTGIEIDFRVKAIDRAGNVTEVSA